MKTTPSPSFFTVAIIATLLMTSSCATIISGSRQRVAFTSNATGARVQVNGLDRGTTPTTVKLKRGYTGQVVTISAQGYESRTFQPETHFNPVTLVSIVVLPFMAFDLLTGAMWKYHPKHYDIQLEKRK